MAIGDGGVIVGTVAGGVGGVIGVVEVVDPVVSVLPVTVPPVVLVILAHGGTVMVSVLIVVAVSDKIRPLIVELAPTVMAAALMIVSSNRVFAPSVVPPPATQNMSHACAPLASVITVPATVLNAPEI